MDIMGTRLGDTSSRHIVIILIDSILHLLQELINVDQIVLGADVAHGREMIRRSWRMATWAVASATHCHRRRHGLVFREWATAQDRERQTLQA
jgi:hypothetical protein